MKGLQRTLRTLLKHPAYFTASVLTLALGIGANAAIFTVVNAVLLRQLPFLHAERTVWITGVRPERSDAPFSLPDFCDYRDSIHSLDALSAVAGWSANLTGQGDTERLNGVRASADLFDTLGVSAALGRTLEWQDDLPQSRPVVMLSYALWQRRFGGDPGLVGKQLELNGTSYTVVGILPANFVLPVADAELAVPLVPDADPWRFDRNTVNFLRLIGRVRTGGTIADAQAEMNTLAHRLRGQFPDSNARKMGVKLTPMREQITGSYRHSLWVLQFAVGFVLLIACANLANLNLVRTSARRREMSVRSALGATRRQLVRQLLIESAVVAVFGTALGGLLAGFGVHALVALSPTSIPRLGQIEVDTVVLVFVLLISLATLLVTGLAPALSVSHGDLARQMNEGSRGSSQARSGKLLRAALVLAEVTLSFVLLAGAGVLLKSFSRAESVDLGFEAGNVLSMRLSLPKARYTRMEDVIKFYEALLPRVQSISGVSAAGVVQLLPMSGRISMIPFRLVGRALTREEIPDAQYRIVNPGYLRAMRIPLRSGRGFEESDTDHTHLVCYVNESLAQRYWPGGSALGAHLLLDDNNGSARDAEIVGVIGNVKDRGPEAPPSFDIYIPMRQTHQDSIFWLQDSQNWVLRTDVAPLAVAGEFRRRLHRVDADVAASNVRSMDTYVAGALGPRRFNLQLMSFFAFAALALALTGIYGVVCYSVSQRTHEIGVRLALGAQPSDVLRMVMANGMQPVLAGLALGIAGVFALSREAAGLLYGVSASDPATLGSVSLLFCVVALAALYLPARRAGNADALAVLKAG